MIWLKFTEVTHDKNTDDKYFVGDVREFKDERATELLEAGVASKATNAEIEAQKGNKSKPDTKEEKKFD
jgi:hypothetical protein